MLTRATGPDCPRCGCNASRSLGTRRTWQGEQERLECDHCGHRFSAATAEPEPDNSCPCVVYVITKCPHCYSRRTRTTSSPPGRLRYHKCLDCGGNFKSIEPDDRTGQE